jgi:hypothetical protein
MIVAAPKKAQELSAVVGEVSVSEYVLITSRTRQEAMQLVEDSDIIPIEPMDDAAAHALLHKKLGGKRKKSNNNDGVAELATTPDHMPLALVQAGCCSRRRGTHGSKGEQARQSRRGRADVGDVDGDEE